MIVRAQWFTLLVFAVSSLAWTPDNVRLLDQGLRTREAQLQEFQESFKPEYDSYMGAGWMFLPSSRQSKLSTPYGLHNGFAFRQRAALLLQNPLDSSNYQIGIGWWVERHGWQSEDFIAKPKYGDFGLVRDVHSWALTLSNKQQALGAALGLQWQNDEYRGKLLGSANDSLWWFTHLSWERLTFQGVVHGIEWQGLGATMEMGDRALRGGDEYGWRTYLPDVRMWLRRNGEDPLTLSLRQNLWAQHVYLDGKWSPLLSKQGALSLLIYADAAHLIGAEATMRRTLDGRLIYGGALEVPFLRLAYNAAGDFDQFFEANGVFLAEIHLSIGAIAQKSIFRRNAPKAAPMETEVLKKQGAPIKDSEWRPEGQRKSSLSKPEEGDK